MRWVKRLSKAQAQLLGGASLAQLIIGCFPAWRQGLWLPMELDNSMAGAISILMVTLVVYITTTEDPSVPVVEFPGTDQPPTTVPTTTGETAVLAVPAVEEHSKE